MKILDQDLVIVGPLGATHLRIRPGSARFALSPLISKAINIIIIIMKRKDVGLMMCFFNTREVFEGSTNTQIRGFSCDVNLAGQFSQFYEIKK